MKTTAKEFLSKSEYKKELNCEAENAKYKENYNLYHKLTEEIKKQESEYFDKLDTVEVSYSIGGRSYYQSVYKIGDAYFLHGRKMTKGRGYYNVCEIEEITQEMSNEMMADSYYY